MRIHGPHDPRTHLSDAASRQGQPAPGVANSPEHTTGAQSRQQAPAHVSDIPPEQLRTLDADLAAAGIDRTSLDAAGMRRAYVLSRHGLPLTRAAITHDPADVPPVLRDAASLITEVRQVIETGSLSAADRSLLQELAANLEGLFDSTGTAGNTLADTIESWTTVTELRLLTLIATGETTGSDVDMFAGAGRLLLSDAAVERLGSDIAALIAGFRDAASQLRAASSLGESISSVTAEIQAAFTQLETALYLLTAGAEHAAASEGIGSLLPAVRELFTRQLTILHQDILPFVSVHESGGPTAQVRASGLSFEWRLFSWYVSGGSPERLRQLMQHDLKGVLLSFLSGLRERGKQGQKSPFQKIGQHARTIVDHITAEQLATVTGRSASEHPVFFELPLAGQPGSGQARITLSGEHHPVTPERPREMTLSFRVDTSVLGEVAATMRITGDAVSMELLLTRDEWAELGEIRAEELREQLREQGFTVGEITFRRFDKVNSSDRGEAGA